MTTQSATVRAATALSIVTILASAGYAAASPSTAGSARHQPAAAKARSGSGGPVARLGAVAAVPGTSFAYVVESQGPNNDKYSVQRLHNGHLKKVWSAKLGSTGALASIVAVSKSNVYVGGAKQVGPNSDSINNRPAIFRLKGKKFVSMKLPATDVGAAGVGPMAASSATNVWADGGIYPLAGGGPQALRYDGKKWAFTATPQDTYFDGQTDIATSAPNNVWTDRQGDGNLLFWDGTTWHDLGAAPISNPGALATSSRHLVYLAGTDPALKPEIVKNNGKKWVKTKLKGVPSNASIPDITMAGKQAWAVAQWRNKKNYTVSAILHTTGGVWKKQYVTHGKGLNFINAISASSAKHVFAVGSHNADYHLPSHPITFTLHGHKWKAGK